ncbi:hypothetical protein KIL84_005660 [Mauremys mutica]|uniref:Uncharacterized protein n=1 Tax=Mauremys mutica TaxID=74926 RepID=A0A9D4B461_9SAUR|nr:hypothetical protein KIL84_005660 [Mauremys mutica]
MMCSRVGLFQGSVHHSHTCIYTHTQQDSSLPAGGSRDTHTHTQWKVGGRGQQARGGVSVCLSGLGLPHPKSPTQPFAPTDNSPKDGKATTLLAEQRATVSPRPKVGQDSEVKTPSDPNLDLTGKYQCQAAIIPVWCYVQLFPSCPAPEVAHPLFLISILSLHDTAKRRPRCRGGDHV